MNIFKRYLNLCRSYGGEETRSTYYGELNYQCSRLFPFVPLIGCAWFPYIHLDLAFELSAYTGLIVGLRIGLFAAGICTVLLRIIPRMRLSPLLPITLFISYVLWAAAVITGLQGGNPSYAGGFLFLIMVLTIPPIPVHISLSILASSLIIFISTAFPSAFRADSLQGKYALLDLFNTSAVAILFIILLNKIRYTTWEKRCLAIKQKDEIDSLLCNILPKPIVAELQKNDSVRPVFFPSATIMFGDIVGFTRISEHLPAEILVKELNDLFSSFDRILDMYSVEKLKTIGDAYMAACGVPFPVPGHEVKAVLMSMEMLSLLEYRNTNRAEHPEYDTEEINSACTNWQMRIGINSGSIMAGIIGERKFIYDVWGESVNIAARLESSGKPGIINISETTAQNIKHFFTLQERGIIPIKNAEPVSMYFVTGIHPELSVNGEGKKPSPDFYKKFELLFKKDS